MQRKFLQKGEVQPLSWGNMYWNKQNLLKKGGGGPPGPPPPPPICPCMITKVDILRIAKTIRAVLKECSQVWRLDWWDLAIAGRGVEQGVTVEAHV